MLAETRRIFQAFVDQAARIKNNGFEHHVHKVGLTFSATRKENGLFEIEFGLPDDKERDAFLLTFRMFYQNDDEVGILQQKRFLNDPGISQTWKEGFIEARKLYLNFLHGCPPSVEPSFWGELPTREKLLNTVLYGGGLVHVTKNHPEDRVRFIAWTKDDIRLAVLMQEFTKILIGVLVFIYRMSDLCQAELAIGQ